MKKLSFTKIWFEPTPVAEQVHYGASIFTGFFGSFYVRKNAASPPLAGEPQITWVFPRRLRRRGKTHVICGSPASGGLAVFFRT